VTDPGFVAGEGRDKQGFARVFYGEPSIGGRYSVLSPFGLVPAAAAGIDVRALITRALAMVRSCGPDVPPHENPERATRACHGPGRPRRPRQGDDLFVEKDCRLRAPGPSN